MTQQVQIHIAEEDDTDTVQVDVNNLKQIRTVLNNLFISFYFSLTVTI
jgi:hypothetical protein